jgi:hypothetical protein
MLNAPQNFSLFTIISFLTVYFTLWVKLREDEQSQIIVFVQKWIRTKTDNWRCSRCEDSVMTEVALKCRESCYVSWAWLNCRDMYCVCRGLRFEHRSFHLFTLRMKFLATRLPDKKIVFVSRGRNLQKK